MKSPKFLSTNNKYLSILFNKAVTKLLVTLLLENTNTKSPKLKTLNIRNKKSPNLPNANKTQLKVLYEDGNRSVKVLAMF